MPRDAAIYVRVSSEEQAIKGLSLDAQEANLRGYLAAIGQHVTEVVRDPGVSATVPLHQRPGGRRIHELVTAGTVQAVAAIRLDRLFRDAVDCLDVTRGWDAAGVALHLLDLGGQPVDTSTAMGRFFLTVMAAAAELERNLLRERIRATVAHLAALGVYNSPQAPYGYIRVPRSEAEHRASRVAADFVRDPVAATVLTEMFDRYTQGAGLTDIIRWLDTVDAVGQRGAKWRPETLLQVLANPIYIGMLATGRGTKARLTRQAVNVEPLIDVDVWQRAQALLTAGPPNRRLSRDSTGFLAGLLTCATCGQPVYQSGVHRKAGARFGRAVYYRCRDAMLGRCPESGVMEHILWRLLEPFVLDRLDPACIAERQAVSTEQADRAARRLLELDAATARLMDAYTHPDSAMTADELHRLRAPLDAERRTLADVGDEVPASALPVIADRAELKRLLDAMTRDELRALCRTLIAEVRLTRGVLAGDPIWRV